MSIDDVDDIAYLINCGDVTAVAPHLDVVASELRRALAMLEAGTLKQCIPGQSVLVPYRQTARAQLALVAAVESVERLAAHIAIVRKALTEVRDVCHAAARSKSNDGGPSDVADEAVKWMMARLQVVGE